jgi:hypothetical protein
MRTIKNIRKVIDIIPHVSLTYASPDELALGSIS